jgi:hypothetical protein
LKVIQADIKSANDESAGYNGGLIKVMIEVVFYNQVFALNLVC